MQPNGFEKGQGSIDGLVGEVVEKELGFEEGGPGPGPGGAVVVGYASLGFVAGALAAVGEGGVGEGFSFGVTYFQGLIKRFVGQWRLSGALARKRIRMSDRQVVGGISIDPRT